MATKNTWMNWVSKCMIHEATSKTGKAFFNVSFPYADSATGYASVSVSTGQVRPATKKDGTVNEAFANILLGDPTKVREVSVCEVKGATKAESQYKKVELTNAQIAELYEEARQAYKAAQAPAEAQAEPAPAQA